MDRKLIINKRGSYIIEAAVVLPVIIMVVITTVLIIMFFYSQMTEQCNLHMGLRKQAGMISGNTLYIKGNKNTDLYDVDTYVEEKLFGGSVYGRKNLIMNQKGILYKKGVFTVEGSCYEIDAASYVRYSSAIKGLKE